MCRFLYPALQSESRRQFVSQFVIKERLLDGKLIFKGCWPQKLTFQAVGHKNSWVGIKCSQPTVSSLQKSDSWKTNFWNFYSPLCVRVTRRSGCFVPFSSSYFAASGLRPSAALAHPEATGRSSWSSSSSPSAA